jgi:hypothetical protein
METALIMAFVLTLAAAAAALTYSLLKAEKQAKACRAFGRTFKSLNKVLLV